MYKLLLAYKYLSSRFVIFLALGGVFVSVAALIVIMSVMDGFGDGYRDRLRGTSADILIEEPTGDGILEYEALIASLAASVEGTEAFAPFIEREVMLTPFGVALVDGEPRRVQVGSEDFGVVKGIDPIRERLVGDFDRYLGLYSEDAEQAAQALFVPGKFEAILGRSTLQVREYPNDLAPYVVITAPIYGEALENIYYYRFKTLGRFQTGNAQYDQHYLYTSLEAAQRLMKLGDAVTGIQIKLAPGANPDTVRDAIRAQLELKGLDYPVYRWEEKQEEILDALELEKVMSGLILFMVVVVASFGLITILDMTVSNKQYEIGILGSIGATRRGIATIFLTAGALIGVIGSISGGLAGMVIVHYLPQIQTFLETLFGFQVFPSDLYYFRHIPTRWDPAGYLVIMIATAIICTVVSVIPALHAGRLRPTRCLAIGR